MAKDRQFTVGLRFEPVNIVFPPGIIDNRDCHRSFPIPKKLQCKSLLSFSFEHVGQSCVIDDASRRTLDRIGFTMPIGKTQRRGASNGIRIRIGYWS